MPSISDLERDVEAQLPDHHFRAALLNPTRKLIIELKSGNGVNTLICLTARQPHRHVTGQ